MFRSPAFATASFLAIALAIPVALAQEQGIHPPPYRGVNTLVNGVFVTPVPGAAFSAVVKIESTQVLADGTSETRKTTANIARDSEGRIYNERRQLLPSSVDGTPQLLSGHIFDPQTRLSTFLDPFSHLARQSTVREDQAPKAAVAQPAAMPHTPGNSRFFTTEELGTDTMENVVVHGTRQIRTIPAALSGTGKDVVVLTEYWYSEELHMNMLTKQNDPRTGQQAVTVTEVNRNEPDPSVFQVPAGYKVVDENPPN